MAALRSWLVDTSALVRLTDGPDAEAWSLRAGRGRLRVATVTRLELGYAARNGDDCRRLLFGPPLGQLTVEHLTPRMEDRAVEVLTLLADRGRHRAPSLADLLLAAAAEVAGLTVLHVDKDFDLIAEVTGQPVERLALA